MIHKSLKHSKQRDALLACLKATTAHPSAEELYSEMKKSFPNMSLATVYRNLNQLLSSGQIMNMNVGGTEHYDANCETHFHMVCKKCNSIVDIPHFVDLKKMVNDMYNVKVENYSLIFYGLCNNCKI